MPPSFYSPQHNLNTPPDFTFDDDTVSIKNFASPIIPNSDSLPPLTAPFRTLPLIHSPPLSPLFHTPPLINGPTPKRCRLDLQYGAGDNMSHDDRMSGDVATSSIPSPATQGDDPPYEFLNDSLNESMFASPMGDGGVDSPDQLANSQGGASPGVTPAPYYIEVGRGRAYGQIAI